MDRSIIAILMIVFFAAASTMCSVVYAQDQDSYTFITGIRGPEVCVGQYTPPSSSDVTGVCRGQILSLQQFSAMAARQSADILERIAGSLESIDQRLADNNERLGRLTELAANSQTSALKNEMENLKALIEKRFESLPEELLASGEFMEELEKLKAGIIEDVKKSLAAPQSKETVKPEEAKR